MVNWKGLFKRIPVKVQLGQRTHYEVTWTRDDPTINHKGVSHHNDEKRIVINLIMKERESVITYLHEVAHAISITHEIDLTETQILKLEKALYYLLKSNNVFKEGK